MMELFRIVKKVGGLYRLSKGISHTFSPRLKQRIIECVVFLSVVV